MDAIDWLTIDSSKRLQRENEILKVKKSEIDQLKEKAEEYEAFQSHINPQLEAFQKEVKSLNEQLALERHKVEEVKSLGSEENSIIKEMQDQIKSIRDKIDLE